MAQINVFSVSDDKLGINCSVFLEVAESGEVLHSRSSHGGTEDRDTYNVHISGRTDGACSWENDI